MCYDEEDIEGYKEEIQNQAENGRDSEECRAVWAYYCATSF
jgi:hypothetical protein